MKKIEDYAKQIKEEIADAEKYARCALAAKDDDPDASRLYRTLSQQELEHAMAIHGLAVKKIDEYRKEVGPPPADMQAKYDVLHDLYTDAVAGVRILQAL